MSNALLAAKDLSIVWSAAIDRSISGLYVDNAVVATLSALESGPLRPRDLEHVTRRSSAAVTRILDRLEAAGDLERRHHPISSDQRAVSIEITPQGRRHVREIFEAITANAAELETPIKEALDHLEMLAPSAPSRSVDPPNEVDGICGVLAHLGLTIDETTRASLDDVDINSALTLCVLAEASPSRPGTLTERLAMTSGGMTKLLDRLESHGFIDRSYGRLGSDRRGVEVTLTAVGTDRLLRFLRDVQSHADDLLMAFRDIDDQLDSAEGARE